jgi:hypothetical protein
MYDTLHLWHGGNTECIAPLLCQVVEHNRDESYYITGNLKNFNLCVNEKGVSIKGSLAKWFFGNNIQTLTRVDTKQAIEALSDTLHLSLKNAKLSRIDFAQNFSMQYEPKIYYPYFGDSKTFKRSGLSTSLYYTKKNINKLFYDKNKEYKANNGKIDESLFKKNLLRFEVRFMKQLPKIFNKVSVNVGMLYDEDFYVRLFNKWFDEYSNIDKISKMAFREDVLLKPSDFFNQLTLKSIIDLGGQNEVLELIEETRKRGQFERPEYPSRAKGMIKDLFKNELLFEPSELIQELENKVRQFELDFK